MKTEKELAHERFLQRISEPIKAVVVEGKHVEISEEEREASMKFLIAEIEKMKNRKFSEEEIEAIKANTKLKIEEIKKEALAE